MTSVIRRSTLLRGLSIRLARSTPRSKNCLHVGLSYSSCLRDGRARGTQPMILMSFLTKMVRFDVLIENR